MVKNIWSDPTTKENKTTILCLSDPPAATRTFAQHNTHVPGYYGAVASRPDVLRKKGGVKNGIKSEEIKPVDTLLLQTEGH